MYGIRTWKKKPPRRNWHICFHLRNYKISNAKVKSLFSPEIIIVSLFPFIEGNWHNLLLFFFYPPIVSESLCIMGWFMIILKNVYPTNLQFTPRMQISTFIYLFSWFFFQCLKSKIITRSGKRSKSFSDGRFNYAFPLPNLSRAKFLFMCRSRNV